MNERETALNILMDIFETGGYNNIVLRKSLKKNNALSQTQKAFVTEIVNGTLRNIILIDYVIDLFSKTKTNKMKSLILNVIRISVYQILFMDRTPNSAVCNEAVNIVKRRGFKNLSGFVNGVLRNIVRNSDTIQYPSEDNDKIKFLAVKYSYPEWIIKYWLEEFDYDTVKKMCAINNTPPSTNICVNTNKISKDELITVLEKQSVQVKENDCFDDFLIISGMSDISEKDAYSDGLFHIMDISSGIAVKMLDPQPNENILDVCGAPGGKSFYSAYIMKNKGSIILRDIYAHKLLLAEDMKKRLGIDIIKTEEKDACVYYEDDFEKFDKIIIDAPCSGLGMVRKKPDIKFLKTYDDVLALSELQKKILQICCQYVKKGGVLIYSTCTLSLRENNENVKWFLENFPFEIVETKTILPQQFESDGFFVAKFIKK